MNHKWIIVLGFSFVALCSNAMTFSQGESVIIGEPTEPRITHSESSQTERSPASYTEDRVFEFKGMIARRVWVDGEAYTKFSIPQTANGINGLPIFRQIIKVPSSETLSLSAKTINQDVHDLSSLDLPHSILPSLRKIPKVPGGQEAYQLSSTTESKKRRESAKLIFIGKQSDVNLYLLEIYPVSYESGVLTFNTKIHVQLSHVSQVAKHQLTSTSLSLNKRLLIVAPDIFNVPLEPFIRHKESLGWDVDVASLSEVGQTREAIRLYIQTRFTSPSLRPSHLLLCGDSNLIPTWYGQGSYSPDTDLYYACMDGMDDFLPELAYGRFPVRTNEELVTLINKIITYETLDVSERAFVERTTFIASTDNYAITEVSHNSVISQHLEPRHYDYLKLFSHSSSATSQDVKNALNNGASLLTYSGHGTATTWDDPRLIGDDIMKLTNGNKLPLVVSMACDTGYFAGVEDCLAESWLKAEQGGAISVIASTEDSYWEEDDILEKAIYESIFSTIPHTLGEDLLHAKLTYLSHYGYDFETLQYFEQYHLLGDPTLQLWKKNGSSVMDPIRLTRILPTEPLADNTSFEVHLEVSIENTPPRAMIIKEILPEGWQITDAKWNNIPKSPTFTNGEYKWLWGMGSAVESGTLIYTCVPSIAYNKSYILQGALLHDKITLYAKGATTLKSVPFKDVDSDLLPDEWELLYWENIALGNPSLDSDNDGLTNYAEYIADTDPLDPTSTFRITQLITSLDSISLAWQGGGAASYIVYGSEHLHDWTVLYVIPPSGKTAHSINMPLTKWKFYKVSAMRN